MERNVEILKQYGFTADEIDQIEAYYRSDGSSYVQFERAIFDDRREYLD